LKKYSMKQETAIEWMFDKLLEEGPSGELRWHLKYDIFKIFEQAKEMEKKQIIDAFDDGKSDGYKTAREWDEMVIFSNAEQYYNETYVKSKI